MTILLTRPHKDNYPLATQLIEKGHDIIIEPMFEIEHKPFSLNINPTAVIFTSKNAIKSIASQVALFTNCDCYVVGEATAALAKQYGFSCIYVAQNNAYSLLDLICDYADKKFDKLAYFCGEIISLDLVAMLLEMGYQIEEIPVYKTIDRKDFSDALKKKLLDKKIDSMLLYSYHTAEIFLELVIKNNMQFLLKDIDLYIISSKLNILIERYQWNSVKLISDLGLT